MCQVKIKQEQNNEIQIMKRKILIQWVATLCNSLIALGFTLVALGILSMVPMIGATEAVERDASKGTIGDAFSPDVKVSLHVPLQSTDNLSLGAVTESSEGEESASELNRKLTNPVSDIWSISNQFNNFELNNGQWNNNWNFQPVMPVSLTKDWNLITRPVMPFYNIVPHETSPGEFARDAGLGDLTLLELLSPANSGNWVFGAGPTAIFPTATSHFTGQGKWQLGPSVVVGYLTKEFFIGVFPQQWWSIGGEHGRPDTNQMNLQPIATIFFGEGWSFGYSGNILADWTAPSPDVWTVPIGLGLGKVVKFGRLPVKIQLAVQYMPVHPRISGQEWNVQVQITPVIPKLIKGALFQ
jgi:hypothetical protein